MGGIKDGIKDNKKILLLSFGLLVVCFVGMTLFKNGLIGTNSLIEDKTYTKAEDVMEDGIDYQAILKTSFGNIKVDLFEKETPITVNNFLFLVGKKYYEKVLFHRVINGFVIQTGDPTGTGKGGPGYYIKNEITSRKYESYVLGMANAGADTNGSQFFITSSSISDTAISKLNGNYTIFGKVIEGFSVVDSIERVETDDDDKPVNNVYLESIQILEN